MHPDVDPRADVDHGRDPAGPSTMDEPAGWSVVVDAVPASSAADEPPSLRRLVLQMSCAALAVLILVAVAGSFLSQHIAENQAVHEVAETTDLVAESVVQPALTNAMATDRTAAAVTLGPLVRKQVLSATLIRVKIWSPTGTIVYSDEPRLVGRTFPLDDGARGALSEPQTRAEITNLSLPENQYESTRGKLLEVYRPVWTPDGHELLFETYFRYDVVTDRSSELWRAFGGITLSSVAIAFVLMVPIIWTLLRRSRRARQQREDAIRRSLQASVDERRRIAATLHDGVVQELVAASFAVAGGAQQAAGRGEVRLADDLDAAAATVRTSLQGLRTLLVDIYPPALHSSGLAAALKDVVAAVRARGVDVATELDEAAGTALPQEQQQALFRIAQEALRNTLKHARAARVSVVLRAVDDATELTVSDDGAGFDPSVRPEGHFGLSLMADLAREGGVRLELRTAPGQGTDWRATVVS